MLEVFSNGFRITALFLLLVFMVIVILYENPSFKKQILVFFLLTTCGYLLAYWNVIQTISSLFQITFFLSVLFPISFWLLSKALFNDDFYWNIKYVFFTIVSSFTLFALYQLNDIYENTFYENFRLIPYLISMAFIFLVIYESLKNKENDLVISRIKKRNAFIIFSSFLALISLAYFFLKDPMKLPEEFILIQNVFTSIFVVLFFSDQFQYEGLFVDNIKSKVKIKGDTIIQKRIIEKLHVVLNEDKIYAQEGITISKLSEIINEKEYLVRKAINSVLGYSNFNNFLNHYRITEARRLLQESSYKQLTFQEIAFQMGYQSVATFNRAF